MESHTRIVVVAVVVSLATCFVCAVADHVCAKVSYEPSMVEYANSVEHVLDDIVTVAANHPRYNYQTQAPFPAITMYGHANCNPALAVMECVTCLSNAKTIIKTKCPNKILAVIILKDCAMSYAPFKI